MTHNPAAPTYLPYEDHGTNEAPKHTGPLSIINGGSPKPGRRGTLSTGMATEASTQGWPVMGAADDQRMVIRTWIEVGGNTGEISRSGEGMSSQGF